MNVDGNADAVEAAREAAEKFREVHGTIKTEVGRIIVGQEAVIDSVLSALLAVAGAANVKARTLELDLSRTKNVDLIVTKQNTLRHN